MATEDRWYAKTEDGSEFGPVGLETLKSWAREGRLDPSSSVSCDHAEWIPAPQVKELEMQWLVEVEPGQYYGPFHRDVVVSLFAQGQVPSQTCVYKLSDVAAERDVSEVRKSDRTDELEKRVKSLTAELAESQSGAAKLKTALEASQAALGASEKRVGELTGELEDSRAETSEAKDVAARLSAELAQTSAARTTVEGRLERLQAELGGSCAAQKELKTANGELKVALAALDARARALTAELSAERAHAVGLAADLKKSDKARGEAADRAERLSAALHDCEANKASVESALKAAECQTKSLAEEVEKGKSALATALAFSKKREDSLVQKLAKSRSEVADARTRAEELAHRLDEEKDVRKAAQKQVEKLRGELEKLSRKQSKIQAKEGKGLFGGRSIQDLSVLEMAVRRELSAAKSRSCGVKSPMQRPEVAAIDVEFK